MSERTYALRKLRDFILKRGRSAQRWKPRKGMKEKDIDDELFAIKMRVDKDPPLPLLLELNDEYMC